jgi:hypothetical protein
MNEGSTSGSAGEASSIAGSSGSAASFGSGGSASVSKAGSFSSSGAPPNGGTFSQGGGFGTSGSTFSGGTGGTGSGAGGAAGGMGGKAGAAGGGAGGKGGSGSTGGATATGCPAKTAWTATASIHADACDTPDSTSDYCGPPARAIDGDATKRFSTGEARKGTEWLQIDFSKTVTVSQLTLITPNTDFTLAYEVRLSNDAGAIAGSAVVASGTGMQGTTTITLPANKAGRYLRINQTMAMAGWWSVYEMNVTCQ